MRWLITGGTGFIGRNLVIKLLQEGEEVVVVDKNPSFGSAEPVIKDLCGSWSVLESWDFLTGDKENILCDTRLVVFIRDFRIKSARDIRPFLDNTDVVVHLAALSGLEQCENSRLEAFQVNVETVFSLLQQCFECKLKRFIFASSGAVFSGRELDEHQCFEKQDFTCPKGLYASTKDFGENLCKSFSNKLDIVILRLSNVYGPYSEHKTSVIHKFINNIINDKTIEIYGDGTQQRDFIFVDDVVNVIMSAARYKEMNISGNVFHVSSGVSFPIYSQTVSNIKEILHEVSNTEYLNINFKREKYPGVKRFCMLNSAETLTLLNWHAKTNLSKGIKMTFDWYNNYYKDI